MSNGQWMPVMSQYMFSILAPDYEKTSCMSYIIYNSAFCCNLQVSSPGAERLLKVPEDLHRFKDFPMVVSYVEGDTTEAKSQEKTGYFVVDSIETESEHCVWKLADIKENRDPASKGRPMSRKRKDWRLKLPYSMLKKVALYLDS